MSVTMQIKANSPDEYIYQVDIKFKKAIIQLRETVLNNIPEGFSEQMSYGMIGFVVPFGIYPSGYHCDHKLPLPFLSIAAQKNFIALYHMGIYLKPELLKWFIDEYPIHSNQKPDMGKSCIRFKNPDQIPYDLIAQLVRKMTVSDWILTYESNYIKK